MEKENLSNESSDDEMEDAANGHDDYDSSYDSSYSSPVRFSSSENSVNTPTSEPDVHKEDQNKGNSIDDIEIRGHEEDNSNYNSAYNSSYSSPVRSSNSQHLINAFADEHDMPKEIGDSLNDATLNSNANEMAIRGLKEDNSTNISSSTSPVGISNSLNSVNVVSGEQNIPKDDNENGNYVNYKPLSPTLNETKIRDPEDGNSSDFSLSFSPTGLSSSLKAINVVSGEQNIQKEDNENGNYANDQTLGQTENKTKIRDREDGRSTAFSSSSSPAGLSNSLNSITAVFGELDIQKEDNENSNSINDIEIIGSEDCTPRVISSSTSPVKLSNPLNSTNAISSEPGIFQKKDNENCNFLNDATLDSVKYDIEIRGQEEGKSTNNSSSSSPVLVSTSDNVINGLSCEPDVQIEVYDKGNIVTYTAEQGKILDSVKDVKDIEQSSETSIVNHQYTENVDMKSKNGELNDQKGITDDSPYEETETGDIKPDSKENTSNKEQRLVLYGSREPNIASWSGKASVLSKFLKFKSLYTVSNIFRRLSKKTDVKNDSNEYNINDENSSECSPRSIIGISDENCQEDKNEPKEVALESPELKAIKGRIILYTKLWCKDCKEARSFLRNKKLRYSEINIDVYPSRKKELEEISGSLLVPKVFFNQVLIGGLNELKGMDESGQLEEKIEFVTSEEPSQKAPLPPLSGEDDVSSRGIIDELAIIVRKMKESVVVKDRFYKFRRVTNCFRGSEAVDFLTEDQFLERAEAIEFGRKLAKELFFRHALEENTFEDGNHPYRFLDHDPVISQCQNIPRGMIQLKRQPLVELSHRLKFLVYAILDAYTSEDGRHIAYRTIHGSEEFARYLRIAEELQRLDLNRTSKEERLAFFINLYNMMAIHAILVWGYPEGALDRRKLLNDFKYVIGGCVYSLSDIYNGILRSNQRAPYTLVKPFGITDKRFKVSLPYPEPLIHFALVFGNRSAPALRCYCPKNIDRELMDAARHFLQSGAFVLDLDSMTVSVTKILKWYSVDFGRNEVEVLKHAANYLDIEKTQTLLELINNTQLKVVYQAYDWRVNS